MNFRTPSISLSALGIICIKSLESVESMHYCAGRRARILNLGIKDHPVGLNERDVRDWQRGWGIVDYDLRHPRCEEADYT